MTATRFCSSKIHMVTKRVFSRHVYVVSSVLAKIHMVTKPLRVKLDMLPEFCS